MHTVNETLAFVNIFWHLPLFPLGKNDKFVEPAPSTDNGVWLLPPIFYLRSGLQGNHGSIKTVTK